ncbi:MAG: serine/threonine protein kinase, partial [bacterium]
LIGQTIAGKYRLLSHLGSGGFGSVFVAEHVVSGQLIRKVAVKITKRSLGPENSATDLFSDALLLGRITCESADTAGKGHLMNLYDLGVLKEFDNRCYIVMEFIDGKILADHIRLLSRCPVATGVRWAKQLCKGLAVLHRLDPPVIHRDLKADNVIISKTNELKIIDFGLACRLDSITGFALGTAGEIHHMAPEVFMNKGTCASDVFSVGVLLYELFAGVNPFQPDKDEMRRPKEARRTHQFTLRYRKQPEPIRPRNIEVDEQLQAILFRCLRPKPEERYPDASALLHALTAWEDGKQTDPHRAALESGRSLFEQKHYLEASRKLQSILKMPGAIEDRVLFETCWLLGQCQLALYQESHDREQAQHALRSLQQAEKLNEQHVFLKSGAELSSLLRHLSVAHQALELTTLAEQYKQRAENLS